ncbi:hypothetical protein LCGC14_1416310 [marine sediment metagenome]|uniref:Uncharacterized protein n=1 Tax=marine sediment metagenome TaxID=412755 RepID=A0A0F9JSR6_9ZZZZ
MWLEIIISLLTGWILGIFYTNYGKYILKRKRDTAMPAVYSESTIKDLFKGEPEQQQLSMPCNDKSSMSCKVKAYEDTHNSTVVFVNHGRKQNSMLGIDFNLFGDKDTLCTKDAQALLDILRDTPDDRTIDLILHTTGGSMASAEVMVKALLSHSGSVRIYIPYYAESAGTLIALAGHEIHIGKGGWLTQVDPQFGCVSAADLLEYSNRAENQQTWFSDLASLGRVGAQKAMDRAVDLMRYICEVRRRDNKQLVELLVLGRSNHDRPLTEDLLTDMQGLSFGISEDVMRLYKAHTAERR